MKAYVLQHKWRMLGIGWGIVCLFLLFNSIVPGFQRTLSMYEELKEKNGKIASVQNWQGRLQDLNSRKNKLEEFFSEIYVSLPRGDQMSEIIEEFYDKVRISDIRLDRVSPSEREEFEAYQVLPFRLNVRGSFHGIGTFVNELERSRYLIRINQVALSSGDETPVPLTAELLVHVLVLKDSQPTE